MNDDMYVFRLFLGSVSLSKSRPIHQIRIKETDIEFIIIIIIIIIGVVIGYWCCTSIHKEAIKNNNNVFT